MSRARDVVVPHPAADRVEHDPLKAVVVPYRPAALAGLRECGHHDAGQMQVLLDKGEVRWLRKIETALHLLFRWWAVPGLSKAADRVLSFSIAGPCRMSPITKMKHEVRTAIMIWSYGFGIQLSFQHAFRSGKAALTPVGR